MEVPVEQTLDDHRQAEGQGNDGNPPRGLPLDFPGDHDTPENGEAQGLVGCDSRHVGEGLRQEVYLKRHPGQTGHADDHYGDR